MKDNKRSWKGDITSDQAIHLEGTETVFYNIRQIADYYKKPLKWVKERMRPSVFKFDENNLVFRVVDIKSAHRQMPEVRLEEKDILKTWVD